MWGPKPGPGRQLGNAHDPTCAESLGPVGRLLSRRIGHQILAASRSKTPGPGWPGCTGARTSLDPGLSGGATGHATGRVRAARRSAPRLTDGTCITTCATTALSDRAKRHNLTPVWFVSNHVTRTRVQDFLFSWSMPKTGARYCRFHLICPPPLSGKNLARNTFSVLDQYKMKVKHTD